MADAVAPAGLTPLFDAVNLNPTSHLLALSRAQLNTVLCCLSVADRATFSACSAASSAHVLALYEALRGAGPGPGTESGSESGGAELGALGRCNICDLACMKFSESELERLMSGELVPSGRWCAPTGDEHTYEHTGRDVRVQ